MHIYAHVSSLFPVPGQLPSHFKSFMALWVYCLKIHKKYIDKPRYL